MRRLLLLLPLLATFLPISLSADVAHCSPNAISSATVYTNYVSRGDTLIAFAYDVASTCYPAPAGEAISIALVPTSEVYGANALVAKGAAMPPDLATSDANQIYGVNWMASGLESAEALNWSSFYFQLRLARFGEPGLVEILLSRTKGAGAGAEAYEPTDGPALLGRGSFDGNRLSTTPGTVTIHFDSGPTLQAGTNNYAVILRATSGDAANYVTWRVETGIGTNIGTTTANSGGTWTAIGAGVRPHVVWHGRTLATGTAQFNGTTDILVEYLQDEFQSGVRPGTLYWPTDITPTSDHDLTIPNYVLVILNKTNSLTEPDAVYRLDDACQIIRIEVLPSGFVLTGLSPFADQAATAAEGIPFLELLMGNSQSLATNLGLSATAAFLLLTIFFSLIAMVLVARLFPNPIVVLLAGMLPIVLMVMNDLLPELIAVIAGIFVVLYITWRTAVKGDV